ncbi:mitochondrial enolase superfamily member 1 [Pterocles gutturalis]
MDFRYITDMLTDEEAYEILQNGLLGKKERKQQMLKHGCLACTRSCAWLGYSDQQLKLMLDANQQWEIKEAIEWVTKPSEFKSLWIRELTFSDEDMHIQMGHATISMTSGLNFLFFPLRCHHRVIFKQLLQAKALSYLQIDSCRLGSVNENLSVLLMARKFQNKFQNAVAMRKSFSPHIPS